MLRSLLGFVVALSAACAGDPGSPAPAQDSVRLQEVAQGLERPLFLASPPGDPRLFVVEQPGRVRIIENGQLQATPFLDITDRVRSGGERGLLGLAFHPAFANNGWFFVNYTGEDGATRIERYQVRVGGRNFADPASARRLMTIPQPFANHNGGMITFGQDGMLYIGMGDGGSGGDPQNNGQSLNTLLGKMLRIDVDRGDPYGVPADNPYVGRAGARPEIWATGLRNPWRFSIDRTAGLLYVADVGQNAWEEVHVVPAREAGVNYGWKIMEGAHCFRTEECDRTGLHIPQLEYSHSDGCSITGGYVYRGRQLPSLVGHYFYADYCKGWVRSFRFADGRAADQRAWELGDVGQIMSFGQDAAGELYLLSTNGKVYRLAPG